MTTYTDEFAAIVSRSQEATTSAVRSWAGIATTYADRLTAENPLAQPARVHTLVGTWFDLAGTLLGEQRKFAATLIDAGTDVAGTATEHVRTATEQVRTAATEVPDGVHAEG